MTVPSERTPDFDAMIRDKLGNLGFENVALPHAVDDPDSPEVDCEVLKQFANRELPPRSAKMILGRVLRYRNWRDAFRELMLQHAGMNKKA